MEKVSEKEKVHRLTTKLFIVSIISGVVFLISALIITISDVTDIIAITVLVSAIIAIGSFALFCSLSSASMKEEKEDWLDTVLKEHNIKNEDIKFSLKKSSTELLSKELLYTHDKRLFYLEGSSNVNESKLSEIKLNDILKLDLECTTMEHNRKRIIALTTTYDNIKSITDVQIKIITDYRIYSIELDKTKESVDKATQFKLTLDRELKALNQ